MIALNLNFPSWASAIIAVALLGGGCSEQGAGNDAAREHGKRPPDIVLFLFDDAGFSDISAFGGEVSTPTINRLAREGVLVPRFYTAARCSPTRAGILSGLHPHSVGMADLAGYRFATGLPAYSGRLPRDVPLLTEKLRASGYRNYLQGKWHLGGGNGLEDDPEYSTMPNLRGFDHYVGILQGQANPYPVSGRRSSYLHNGEAVPVDRDWYSLSGLNDLTLELLARDFAQHPSQPVFIFVASQAPHKPVAAPDALVEKYRSIYNAPLETIWTARVEGLQERGLLPATAGFEPPLFNDKQTRLIRESAPARAAMIEAADAELGRLLDFLEVEGRLDNTLVLVASDNGASTETARLTNAPFRGAKGKLWEGGTRSSLVAWWPSGGLQCGCIVDAMTSYLDLFPTVLAAAGDGGAGGGEYPGRNLLGMLQGERLRPPDHFFWNLYGSSAVLFQGRWKLVVNGHYDEERERLEQPDDLMLFDLYRDPAETRNIAPGHRELVDSLYATYQAWARRHSVVPNYRVQEAYEANRRR